MLAAFIAQFRKCDWCNAASQGWLTNEVVNILNTLIGAITRANGVGMAWFLFDVGELQLGSAMGGQCPITLPVNLFNKTHLPA